MTEPLELAFEVACSADHAFSTWTDGLGRWWPADHTVSGERDVQVVLEGQVGGRIYERTAAGTEHDWGEVTEWDPPRRLRYRWHLGSDSAVATDVTVRFTAQGTTLTRITIEQRGFERLASAEAARNRNQAGWAAAIDHYTTFVTKGD